MFKNLSLERYLSFLQASYFILYKTGLLKFSNVYTYHYYVKRLINKGDVVIDIGANLGYYSRLFAKWTGSTGTVHAVEPIPLYNKMILKATKKYKNIKLYQYAFGIEAKEVKMISYTHTDYLQTGRLKIYDPQKDGDIRNYAHRFNVQMVRPSCLFKALPRVDYIKCDIEGQELIVLSDLKGIIQSYFPIVQVEISGGNKEKLNSLFAEMGYALYMLEDKRIILEREVTDGRGGEYLFIHENDIGKYVNV